MRLHCFPTIQNKKEAKCGERRMNR
uniref:Uncharacterized protein n=1 Tax=Rhizophora mucronata TaxID=61149 RepID=A0A2P2NTQ2_RHIMU